MFTRTKHRANRISDILDGAGIPADAIHGNKSQNARQRALERFRSGEARVLVATDIAARGIDIDDITHVINFELPNEPESYVHRIGRTARAGATGVAISLCDATEMGFLRDIEKLTRKQLTVAGSTPAPQAQRPAPRGQEQQRPQRNKAKRRRSFEVPAKPHKRHDLRSAGSSQIRLLKTSLFILDIHQTFPYKCPIIPHYRDK